MATPFQPSIYQQAIFDWMQTGTGHGVCEAVAGGSKSTSLVQSLKYTRGLTLFMAFGREIVADLRTKIPASPNVDIATSHSVGFKALRKDYRFVELDEKNIKILRCVSDVMGEDAQGQIRATTQQVEPFVKMCMATLTDPSNPEAIIAMMNTYSMDTPEMGMDRLMSLLPAVMSKMEQQHGLITYEEMLYRPIKRGLTLPVYDTVLVDEVQDMAAVQVEMILRLSQGGRVLAVGDSRQAIFLFRGADAHAMSRVTDALSATILPLSITYRLPMSHVALAKALVPHIEARPNAPEGTILHMDYEKVLSSGTLRPGTLVLCRTNAPLVGAALNLIRNGTPALVRGRDIGQGLTRLIERIWDGECDVPLFLQALTAYEDQEERRLAARNAPPSMLQGLRDRIDTIYALSDGAQTVRDILHRIDSMFKDIKDSRNVVSLSSVHRAKGLEAERTVILRPDILGVWGKTPQEYAQELNIKYVAITRSKDTMIFAHDNGASRRGHAD